MEIQLILFNSWFCNTQAPLNFLYKCTDLSFFERWFENKLREPFFLSTSHLCQISRPRLQNYEGLRLFAIDFGLLHQLGISHTYGRTLWFPFAKFHNTGHQQLSNFCKWEPSLLLFISRKETKESKKYKMWTLILVYRDSSTACNSINLGTKIKYQIIF